MELKKRTQRPASPWAAAQPVAAALPWREEGVAREPEASPLAPAAAVRLAAAAVTACIL